ncbi:MAG: reactive intermediate/imine deaminase [Gammaproteobacteria bacterium]|nr:MAG: reactive intermediate/imine deaminase [Gammaproteobacteria bacterium]
MKNIPITLVTFLLVLSTLLTTDIAAETETKPTKNKITYHNSGKILPADLPFSELVQVGKTLYLSGQIGVIPGHLKLVAGGLEQEAKQTLENIKSILEHYGFSMDNLVKCTVMLTDMSEWAAFNEIYKTYFTKPYPARSAFGASGLAINARVEVECLGAVE